MRYHLFIDESGDPSLKSINSDFPIFTLLGCIMTEASYVELCEKIKTLKINIFGTESAILHSRDIRKCEGVFAKLFDLDVKETFYNELNKIIIEADFKIIAVVINKEEFIETYGKLADDPYELSLSFLLERAIMHTDGMDNTLKIMIESRGSKENAILQKRYNQLLSRGSGRISSERFKARIEEISFRRKKENDCGLQIADLCAYPVARHQINPDEPYPPYDDVVKAKFRTNNSGNPFGYGLKIFP